MAESAATAKPLSRLGFGVTGPHASPLVPAAATIGLVRAAVDLGVTAFDTGPMYGDGEGERRLGAALRPVARERVFVCTKARTFPMRGDDGLGEDPARRVRRSLEQSLARLGLDRVDALLLHGPRPGDMTPGLAALRDLQRAGLVGAVGVCGRGAEVEAALDADIELLMAPLTQERHLVRAHARGVRVLAIETLRGRRRWRWPSSAADLWYLARAARDAARSDAAADASGIAAALARPAVASVIVQTTRLAHLAENAREAALPAGDGAGTAPP